MKNQKRTQTTDSLNGVQRAAFYSRFNPTAILKVSKNINCLDTNELFRLEKSYREWVAKARRSDVKNSRRRILLIFLLIRYTGARLAEILNLKIKRHVDMKNHVVCLGRTEGANKQGFRKVHIPLVLVRELEAIQNDPHFCKSPDFFFRVDPAHVRRKFYERARECGFPKESGNPNSIRRSRAIELLRSNMPPLLVQKLLGLATPGITASVVDFSEADMQHMFRYYVDKESRPKTSARNLFFGKVTLIRKGDIQSEVKITTLGSYPLVTVITNESLARLELKQGSFVEAEVKAPWVLLSKGEKEPKTSAENRLKGSVTQIVRGKITTEYVVTLKDGTYVCSVVTNGSGSQLGIEEGNTVWALFNAFSVIINAG